MGLLDYQGEKREINQGKYIAQKLYDSFTSIFIAEDVGEVPSASGGVKQGDET